MASEPNKSTRPASVIDDEEQKDGGFVDVDTTNADGEETAHVVDKIAERQLCRKFDLRLMPVLAIMCKSLNQFALRLVEYL